jgi:methionyl-tRNA synthetase
MPKSYRPGLQIWDITIKSTKNSDAIAKPRSEESSDLISPETFFSSKIAVGKILSCEAVKDSVKLLRLTVDLGSFGKRQVIAGVAKYFEPEQLVGKYGLFVVNLKPRKLMGLVSEAMMLFSEAADGSLVMLTVDGEVSPGSLAR